MNKDVMIVTGAGQIGDAIVALREERQNILTEAAMNTELICYKKFKGLMRKQNFNI